MNQASLPFATPASRPIVCERTGQWSAALRQELAETGVRVWECRRLAEAWAALTEAKNAFVIVEATAENLDDLLDRLSWLSRDFPAARAAVVADRGLARYQWLAREAGAVHFVTSPRRLAELAAIVGRHIARAPAPSQTIPSQTIVEQIWASLPWTIRPM